MDPEKKRELDRKLAEMIRNSEQKPFQAANMEMAPRTVKVIRRRKLKNTL